MAIVLSLMIELGSSLLLDVAGVGKRREEGQAGEIAVAATQEPADATVEAWARAALQFKRSGSIRCTEAREAFERSVRASGRVPPALNAFGRAMTALGHKRKKKGGHFHYVGVTLSSQSLKLVS